MPQMEKTIALTVNGARRSVTTAPDRFLLDVLREDLQLTGVKAGCGEGGMRRLHGVGGRQTPAC